MSYKRIVSAVNALQLATNKLNEMIHNGNLNLDAVTANWLFAKIEAANSTVNTALQVKSVTIHWHWSVNLKGKTYEKDTGGWVNSREEAVLNIETALSEIRPGVTFEWINDAQCCCVNSRYGEPVDGVISRRSFIDEMQLEDY